AARRLLATAVGVPDLPLDKLAGSLDQAPPDLAWETLRQTVLDQSSEIQEAMALVQQDEQLLQRARAENIPDVNVAVRPFYSAPDREFRVQVALAAPIPVWNHNQGNI